MTEDSGVLDERRRKAAASDARQQSYSLVEVAQKTGIPMPILLRYKREHPDRVPSHGSGSQQRFPEEALQVLLEIQQEESERQEQPRRGGFGLLSLPRLRQQVKRHRDDDEPAEASAEEPRETGARAAKQATPSRGAGEGAMTLVEVSEKLGIPYPTVARYASQHGDRIPHRGRGRARRFPPEALEVFEQIRRESKPGRPPKKREAPRQAPPSPAAAAPAAARAEASAPPAAETAGAPAAGMEHLARRIDSLERSQRILEGQIRDLLDDLSRPATATVEV